MKAHLIAKRCGHLRKKTYQLMIVVNYVNGSCALRLAEKKAVVKKGRAHLSSSNGSKKQTKKEEARGGDLSRLII